MGAVTEHWIVPYDLVGDWCEECGRAKSLRVWPGALTGCKTCDDVVTHHRCTKRPELNVGETWTCPDCGTLWVACEEEETCGECGQGIGTMRRTWETVPGDRLDTAPRHVPQPFTPFRNLLPRIVDRYDPPGPFGECYQMAGGSWVHVRPGCRCKT